MGMKMPVAKYNAGWYDKFEGDEPRWQIIVRCDGCAEWNEWKSVETIVSGM